MPLPELAASLPFVTTPLYPSFSYCLSNTSHPDLTLRLHRSFSCSRSLFREKHYTLSKSKRTQLLAAIIKEKLPLQALTSVLSTKSFGSSVVTFFSDRIVLFKILRQAISTIASTRKFATLDNVFHALIYRHLLSCFSPVTSRDFEKALRELQASEENILTVTTDTTQPKRTEPRSHLRPHAQSTQTFSPFYSSYASHFSPLRA